jgi:hypothetical protein
VATAAVAALLDEVTVRPIHARVAEDNLGSIRVLERNGFVLVGSEDSFAAARQATITELIFSSCPIDRVGIRRVTSRFNAIHSRPRITHRVAGSRDCAGTAGVAYGRSDGHERWRRACLNFVEEFLRTVVVSAVRSRCRTPTSSVGPGQCRTRPCCASTTASSSPFVGRQLIRRLHAIILDISTNGLYLSFARSQRDEPPGLVTPEVVERKEAIIETLLELMSLVAGAHRAGGHAAAAAPGGSRTANRPVVRADHP